VYIKQLRNWLLLVRMMQGSEVICLRYGVKFNDNLLLKRLIAEPDGE